MASANDNISMALFCDFENVALGVRDANYDKFDIKRVLERLLLKGSIVVKKAYCDWDRYKAFKAPMHEANFELIEIPHVRQSGKNSADIRLVVDALDLCYTKSHVNTFVIISGDSDFSPLVSKLRENAKYVIGVGVKQSTSDLLIANCDEFIFYDDLVRESQRNSARRDNRDVPQPRRTPEEEQRRRAELDVRRSKAVEMAVETYEALVTDRDVGGKIWASVLKEAIKRRNPGFNENYYGFRTFGNLLEEAQARGLLEFGRDEKSSAFVTRGTGVQTAPVRSEGVADSMADMQAPAPQSGYADHHQAEDDAAGDDGQTMPRQDAATDAAPRSESSGSRRRGGRDRGGRNGGRSGGRNRPQGQGEAHAQASQQGANGAATAPAAPAPTVTPELIKAAPPATPATPAISAAPTGDKPAAKKAPARRPRKAATAAAGEPSGSTAEASPPAAKKAARPARKAAAKSARKPAADGDAS